MSEPASTCSKRGRSPESGTHQVRSVRAPSSTALLTSGPSGALNDQLGPRTSLSGKMSSRASTSRTPSRTAWPLRRHGFCPPPRNTLAFGSALYFAPRSVTEARSLRSRTSVTELHSMTGRGGKTKRQKPKYTRYAPDIHKGYVGDVPSRRLRPSIVKRRGIHW
jgi:hypothetical protein